MVRRGKTDRVPKTRAGGEWTEAAFWGFIRSGLRQMSARWPPRTKVMKSRRRVYAGLNTRQKFEYQCEACQRWFPGKKIQVDHREGCGTLKSFADIAGFCERLFCEEDGLRLVCEDCHQAKTNADRAAAKVRQNAG